jgi:hypothetical protein
MKSTDIATMTKMIENLPEIAQNQVVEHMRNYIANLQDELQWDTLFQKTQNQIISAAKRGRQEIAKGNTEPMDYNQL